MKGIILAGGSGSRLYPLTKTIVKGLLPVYDKPMIYYPLTTLIENGVDDILIITSIENVLKFKAVLNNGGRFGVKIRYKVQQEPNGIAEAFILAKDFIKKGDKTCLVLGDNILSNNTTFRRVFKNFNEGCTIFGYEVSNPKSYGVVEFNNKNQAISIEEKPKEPKSNFAIPGVYLVDDQVIEIAKNVKPSSRGELEVTDVIQAYLDRGQLNTYKINRGCVWLDAGTSSSLHEASAYVHAIETRQGVKIGCPEEAGLNRGFITKDKLSNYLTKMPNCEYKDYLQKIIS
jgi:glucose-1-phosphate thymidylyltransferase